MLLVFNFFKQNMLLKGNVNIAFYRMCRVCIQIIYVEEFVTSSNVIRKFYYINCTQSIVGIIDNGV